ncbi:MAG: hypothetical protein K2M12_08620 [Muribaculaceae bacterium]|nr:hypothetical protein [Muribaculaceae bacterium]
MKDDKALHSPKIARMLDDVPRRLVRVGWIVTLGLLAGFAAAMALIPSPYDPTVSIGRHIFSALF